MGLATVDFRQAGGPLVEYEMVHCRHCRAGIPKRLYPDQEKAPGHLLRVEQAQGGFCHPCGGAIWPAAARSFDRSAALTSAGVSLCRPTSTSVPQSERTICWQNALARMCMRSNGESSTRSHVMSCRIRTRLAGGWPSGWP